MIVIFLDLSRHIFMTAYFVNYFHKKSILRAIFYP